MHGTGVKIKQKIVFNRCLYNIQTSDLCLVFNIKCKKS